MYAQFYGLRESPFALTPDPRYLFMSEPHKEALASAVYGVQERKGFVLILGEVGTGKTTLIRHLLGRFGPNIRSVFVFNPAVSFIELLQLMLRDLELPCPSMRRVEMIDTLNDYLLKEAAAGRYVVVIIDEAQHLSPTVLEEVRMLSNLETARGKLIQILLVGQPELGEKLGRPELRQLRQRISLVAELKPLSYEDTVRYIAHRLEVAGREGGRSLLTPGAQGHLPGFGRHPAPRQRHLRQGARPRIRSGREGDQEPDHQGSAEGLEALPAACRPHPPLAQSRRPAATRPDQPAAAAYRGRGRPRARRRRADRDARGLQGQPAAEPLLARPAALRRVRDRRRSSPSPRPGQDRRAAPPATTVPPVEPRCARASAAATSALRRAGAHCAASESDAIGGGRQADPQSRGGPRPGRAAAPRLARSWWHRVRYSRRWSLDTMGGPS